MIKKRFFYIDLLNCFAIFSVLMLHSSQLFFHGNPYSIKTMICGIIQALFIPAVYIFFMNSGAMLLDYRDRQSTKCFIIKRLKRVFIPFLVWTVIYYIYDLRFTASPGPTLRSHPGINDFLIGIANNNINNIFWFFYVILAIYLTIPVLSLVTKDHEDYLFLIVCFSFIMNDILHWLSGIMNINVDNMFFYKLFNPIIMTYLPYAIIGYLLKKNFFSKQQENMIIILGLTTLLLSIVNILTLKRYTLLNNIGPMLYSTSIYILFVRLSNFELLNSSLLHKMFMCASGCSLSMYVLHVIFFKIFDNTFRLGEDSWTHILIMPIIVYIVGTIFIYLFRKIRIIRVILP